MAGNRAWVRCAQIFSAKLVLEVFGGGGAIWGFSEAAGLRNSGTEHIWRPTALLVAAIFFVRWLLQIRDYISNLGEERRRYKEEISMIAASEIDELGLQEDQYGSDNRREVA
mgnify:CR=1 FL=1